MGFSLPSSPALNIELPDVKNISAEFVYNFFVPDEKTNDSGQIPDRFKDFLSQPTEGLNTSRLRSVSKRIPRFVKISFSKIKNPSVKRNDNITFVNDESISNNTFIKDNIDKLIFEELFLKNKFIRMDFQDNNIDNKLFNLVSGSVEKKIAASNSKVLQEIEESKANLFDRLTNSNSLLEKAKTLNLFDAETQRNELILDSLTNIKNLGAKYVDEKKQKEKILSLFDEIKTLRFGSQINKKIFGTISRNILADPMNIYADEFSSLAEPAQTIEQNAVSTQSSHYMFESEYKVVVDGSKILLQRNDINENPSEPLFSSSDVRVVGYLIEKTEVREDGSFVKHEPIIIENQSTTLSFDSKVKYGSRYIYAVRSISVVSFTACNASTNSLEKVKLLMASRRSSSFVIKAEENIPPPPPADFLVSWDYKEDAPRLTWAFPVNSQRDIKRFQVFRRKNINEPFELIREFDFDDSVIKTPNPENPEPDLVIQTKFPITHFIDKEFKRRSDAFSFLKTDRFIYSVRSIDAHGFGSNYSMQFEVSFDNFKNKVISKRISSSGAPIQYPNLLLLNRDTFIDAIKTSNKNRMKVFLDPDFYKILTKDGQEVDVVKTVGSKYKFGIINLDFQEQANLDIEIDDLRDSI